MTLSIAFFVSCGRDEGASSEVGSLSLRGDVDSLALALEGLDEERLRERLYRLASEEFQGRGAGQAGGLKTRGFVAAGFEAAGLEPAGTNAWYQEFGDATVGSRANVLGLLRGQDALLRDEIVVIGAHHDHLGINSSGTIYFGADDNASGTDVVMEVASALSRVKHMLRRSILFVTFDAEEKGLLGSSAYVASPRFPLEKTVYMLNLDMVGYLAAQKNMYCLGCGSSSDALGILNAAMGRYASMGKPVVTASAGAGSDHYPFAKKGIPYGFLHTGTSFSPYHKPTDTADKIDYEGLADTARVATEFVFRLATREVSPRQSAGEESPELFEGSTGLDHGRVPYQIEP
jgi:hypothetical protein